MVKKIAILDDDEEDIELMREAMSDVCPDLHVVGFHYVNDLLSYMQEIDEVDLLIIDLNLGMYKGSTVVAEVRKKDSLRDVPLVIMTGAISIDQMEYLKESNVETVIKPFTFDGYHEIARELCKRYRLK